MMQLICYMPGVTGKQKIENQKPATSFLKIKIKQSYLIFTELEMIEKKTRMILRYNSSTEVFFLHTR